MYVPVNDAEPFGELEKRHRRMTPADAAASAAYDHLSVAMRSQFAVPSAADMQRLQDAMDGLTFCDEVRAAHRQLQRTSQIRVSEDRHPGTIGVWKVAFLATYGKPTTAEKAQWEKIHHRSGENLMTFSDRFKRLHDLCNPTSQLSRKATTDAYMKGLLAIHPRLHEQVAIAMGVLQESEQTFQKASSIAVEKHDGVALYFPIKESTPSPSPAPRPSFQRAQSTSSQQRSMCTLCKVVHDSPQCPCIDPRQASPNWKGPFSKTAWDVYDISFNAMDLRKQGWSQFPCPRPKGAPQPQGRQRHDRPNQKKQLRLPGPPETSHSNDGIFAPDYPASSFSHFQGEARPEKARSLLSEVQRQAMQQQLDTHSYISQLLATDTDAESQGPGTYPWAAPSASDTGEGPPEQPFPCDLPSLYPEASAYSNTYNTRAKTAPVQVYDPSPITTSSSNKRSPRAIRTQQPDLLSAAAPPIPFSAVPLPTNIPISQLPDHLQRLRQPGFSTSSLPPATAQQSPTQATNLPVPLLYLLNMGPGVLEGFIQPDTLVSINIDGRERSFSVSSIHFPCGTDTFRNLLGKQPAARLPISTSNFVDAADDTCSPPAKCHTHFWRPPTPAKVAEIPSSNEVSLSEQQPQVDLFSSMEPKTQPPSPAASNLGFNLEANQSHSPPASPVSDRTNNPPDMEQPPVSPSASQKQLAVVSKQPHTAMHVAALPLLTPLFDCPTVYYLKSGDPDSSLSLIHSVLGTSYPFVRCIYDSGSNLNLISASYCKQHKLEYDATDGLSMLTSSGALSDTAGRVSTPLHFSLPHSKGAAVKVRLTLQVVNA
jgi:hypothetical protein